MLHELTNAALYLVRPEGCTPGTDSRLAASLRDNKPSRVIVLVQRWLGTAASYFIGQLASGGSRFIAA